MNGDESRADLADRIAAALRSWPNRAWLVLPGPVDLAPGLAAHLAAALDQPHETGTETAEAPNLSLPDSRRESNEDGEVGDPPSPCESAGEHLEPSDRFGHWYCDVCGAEWDDREEGD